MSTFVPKGFIAFQQALARLGPCGAEEFRQALYAGTVDACLMDGYKIPLPPHQWGDDQDWNQAVATGRGSVLIGPLYWETTSRGPILVRSDDVDRLFASLPDLAQDASPHTKAEANCKPAVEDVQEGKAPAPPEETCAETVRAEPWMDKMITKAKSSGERLPGGTAAWKAFRNEGGRMSRDSFRPRYKDKVSTSGLARRGPGRQREK